MDAGQQGWDGAGLGWEGETGGREGRAWHGRVFAASDALDLIERMTKEIIRKVLLDLETGIKPN